MSFFFVADIIVALQERRGHPVEARATHSDELGDGAASRAGVREVLFHVDGEYCTLIVSHCDC